MINQLLNFMMKEFRNLKVHSKIHMHLISKLHLFCNFKISNVETHWH
jgi:hypothetical protein